MTKLSKALSIVIGLAIMGTVAAIIYVTIVLAPRDAFTEFYILSPEGKATDYPTQLRVGAEEVLILGIINQEQKTESYRVEIKIDGVTAGGLGPISLENSEKFEELITFSPRTPGEKQKVDFLLYKQGQSEVYKALYLWVNVTE